MIFQCSGELTFHSTRLSHSYRARICWRSISKAPSATSGWRCPSATEPTKSQNITVNWRRSASLPELDDDALAALDAYQVWCKDPPGKDVDAYITSTSLDMIKVWMGDLPLSNAIREDRVRLLGGRYVEKYFNRAISSHVTFGKAPAGAFACDIVTHVMQGLVLKAHGEAHDAHLALDNAAEKIDNIAQTLESA